jgi:hypothetical protein
MANMNTALDIVPLWAVFALALAIIVVAAEVGYRLGRARQRNAQHEKEPTVGAIVAAELGLLAFVLAFTFGMAASRFESRTQSLLDESNAIRRTYLRAKMLPDPEGSESRELLREYVDVRLAAVQENDVESGAKRSGELQDQLWARAAEAAQKDPRSAATSLFIQSANELMDAHAERLLGVRGRIPPVVWLVLIAVAALSFGSLGYSSGLSGARRTPAVWPLALTFAAVMWMVVDLDRPQGGRLRVSQQPLIDLKSSLDGS